MPEKSSFEEHDNLAKIEAEVDALSERVAVLEEHVSAERRSQVYFETRYLNRVSGLMRFSDALDAEIARTNSSIRAPHLDDIVSVAQLDVENAANPFGGGNAASLENVTSRAADPTVKARYRDAMRLVHPDLATDEADRARRTEYTKRLNAAYMAGDIAAIDEVILDFASGRMPINAPERRAVLIQQRLHLLQRVDTLQKEIAILQDSDLAKLREQADELGEDAVFEAILEDVRRDVADKVVRLLTVGRVPSGFADLN